MAAQGSSCWENLQDALDPGSGVGMERPLRRQRVCEGRKMKVRRDRGQCRGRWRTFIQRPRRGMEPSQQLPWPGVLPRGWTSGFHSEKYSPGPSLFLQLHLVFHSRRTEPWQSGPQHCSSAPGCRGKGRRAGPGAPGGRAHGAATALCESPAHLLAKSRTELSTAHTAHLLGREPVCVFRTCPFASPPSLAK